MSKPEVPDQRAARRVRLACVLLLIAASVVPLIAAARLYRPIDDTYITMVYARSLAQGHGFTFGLSAQPTLGTTTPLNTLLLAAIYRLFPAADAASAAVALSVIAWVATGWLWWIGGGALGLGRLARLWIAALVLVETTTWIEHLGMETWLFCFLLTLAVIVYFRGRFLLAGGLVGLLFLTRGEGILLAVVIGLHALAQPDRINRVARLAAGGLIVLLPWAVYATLTFGSPLPSTLAAKSAQTALGFTQPFVVYLAYLFFGGWTSFGVIGFISGWTVGLVAGLIRAVRAYRRMLILPAWALLFVTGYFLLNIPTYKWYALPVMYITVVLTGLALAGLAPLLARLLARAARRFNAARAGQIGQGVTAAALVIVLLMLARGIPAGSVGDWRHDVYRQIAAWIDANTPVGSRVAYVEIGLLAWYGDRPVIDLLGLTNPELIAAVERHDFAAAFAQTQPDVLICASRFAWACRDITAAPDFAAHYQPLIVFTGAELGAADIPDDTFTIYGRTAELSPKNLG